MRIGRQTNQANKTQVVALTTDAEFEQQIRLTFGSSQQIALTVVSGSIDDAGEALPIDQATVVVIDLDAAMPGEMQALERLMAGRTTFVIAHRLSTVQRADLILLLAHGRVAAQGTHDTLLSTSALYRQICATQMQVEEEMV